jgi:hypothetical protein
MTEGIAAEAARPRRSERRAMGMGGLPFTMFDIIDGLSKDVL